MRIFRFIGKVKSNKGLFAKELTLPTRGTVHDLPPDWPATIEPGTLNVRIDDDGFPTNGFDSIGRSNGVKKLDEGKFVPACTIPFDAIPGNTLRPRPNEPLRGTGQAWRARICVATTGESLDCWMFRRIGSGISSQLELISDRRIRSVLNLHEDDVAVAVDIFEGASPT